MKEALQAVRAELEKHYVPLVLDERKDTLRNYSGTGEGCCVQGAVYRTNTSTYDYKIMDVLHNSARELFPGLHGATRHRSLSVPDGREVDGTDNWEDCFNMFPAVYVNNHLGKEAILRVIDHAIEQADKL